MAEERHKFAGLDFGDINIEDNILTNYSTDGKLHSYRLAERKANKGEVVLVVKGKDTLPFTERHVGKLYSVTESEDDNNSDWLNPHVVINYAALYDDQYVVLEKINNLRII